MPRPPSTYTPPTYNTPLGSAQTGRFAELPHSAREAYELASDIDQAIAALDVGQYRDAALLYDAMLSDDRIAGDLETRIAGVLQAPLLCKPPKDTARGRRLADLIAGAQDDPGLWEEMFPTATLYQLLRFGLGLNLGIGEMVWDTDAPKWTPRLRVWHPQHAWFNQGKRAIWLNTMAGVVELPVVEDKIHSDGRWVIFQPWGGGNFPYLFGLVRPLATWFLSRRLTVRDANRYSERQGQALLVGKVPANATPEDKNRFKQALFNPGSNTSILAPQAVGGGGPGMSSTANFGVELVESTAATWQVFPALIGLADKGIGTVILGQDATSTTAGGALSQFKGTIRTERQKRDARDLARTLNQQGLWWWAQFNEGDGAWAPDAYYETEPPDDEKAEADALLALAQALQTLAQSGAPVDLRAIADAHGLPLVDEEDSIGGAVSWPDALEAVRGAATVEDAARRLESLLRGEPVAPAAPNGQGGDAPTAGGSEGTDAPAPRQSEGNAAPAPAAALSRAAARPAPRDLALRARQLLAGLDTAELAQEVRAAAPKRPRAAAKRADRYADRLATKARQRGGQALAPDIRKVLAAVADADGYEDMRRKLVAAFKGMRPDAFSRIISRARMLASLAGQGDVLALL